MAEGNQGCRPNWADFPVVAKSKPSRRSRDISIMKSCFSSHEFELSKNHAVAKTNTISRVRLYRMA